MSLRYKGAVISATPPTLVAGAGASGAWTLQQQMQAIASGYWPVNGPFYIEDVFSTYLYTGNGSTLAINNGIDLAGKGGLVWFKERVNASNHVLLDTLRGGDQRLQSNTTAAQATIANAITSFNSNGFTLGASGATNAVDSYVSWTFRKQPKFFDVVTYTGTGSVRTVAHNLGSVPGCIIIKATNASTYWATYHTSLGNTKAIELNTANAAYTSSAPWNNTTPTATEFTVGTSSDTNSASVNYVAYLFAHDAGGFGLSGSDNVISCGDFTTNSSGVATVNLGYEPQWLLIKQTTGTRGWFMYDNMRGMFANGGVFELLANSTASEQDYTAYNNIAPTATGFVTGSGTFYSSTNYIYIAIRRGPMKTPTSGTSVFSPNAVTMTASGSATITTNFPVDLSFNRRRSGADQYVMDRLRGGSQTSYNYLITQTTAAEVSGSSIGVGFDSNTSLVDNNWQSGVSSNTIWWSFRRAPGFFDVVCVTGGSGTVNTATHNLGVVPELVIQKYRGLADDWYVFTNQVTGFLNLNSTSARIGTTNYMTTTTSTVVNTSLVSNPANNPVIYLFATVAGVSKVGSYTGTGTTKQIDCGFTGGARFVLIKRTDSTGDWYVWDSARGIVAGNDPYLLLNSTAAEVTNTDYVDTYSAGFEISSTAPAAINANGGTFIFLAIA